MTSNPRDSVLKKKDYLITAVGNPEGEDKPNKKYFDVSSSTTSFGRIR